MASKKSTPRKSYLLGRDARTGEFIPVEKAKKHKDTSVVERIPLPKKK
jgi:hypothetical protein